MKALILISILSFTAFLASCQENKRIDSATNTGDLRTKITTGKATLNEFKKRKKLLQLGRLQSSNNTPYLLGGFIYQFNPKWEEVSGKIDSLGIPQKLTLFKIIFENSFEFINRNKEQVVNTLEDIEVEKDRLKTLKQALLICLKINASNYTEYFSKIDNLAGLNWGIYSLLCKTVENNRENEFSIHLLSYLSKRDDWKKLSSYLNYRVLYETQNNTQNDLFKLFFIQQLETVGYYENPWNRYADFLPKWLTENEIIDLCKKKKAENYSIERYFYNELRMVSNIEEYVSVASFYQVKYLSYFSSLELINQLKIIDQRLDLIYKLAHIRELTIEQKDELIKILLEEKEHISSSNSSELLILTLRALNPKMEFEYINKTFPHLYSKWTNPKHLNQLYTDSKFDFKDFISIANDNEYFSHRLSYPSDYLIASFMAGNDGFRLNNISSVQAVFEENNIGVHLNDEYGDYPIDYGFIIEANFNDVFKWNFGEDIYSYYESEKIEESTTNYTVHVFFRGLDFKINIKDSSGYPDNEAIIQLMNGILGKYELEKQFIKYGYDNYYCLADKDKFEQLVKKVKTTDNVMYR